jgi:transcription elongation factor GreA
MTKAHHPTFLTQEAFDKLKAELEHLVTEGRARVEERIQTAREHGDLRENADYDAAKNDQGLMEARIRQLEHLLNTAVVGEVPHTEEVVIGSLVTVIDHDGDRLQYFVAPPENKVPGVLLASPSGPLGRALPGLSQSRWWRSRPSGADTHRRRRSFADHGRNDRHRHLL